MASDSQYGENFQNLNGFPNIPKIVQYNNNFCDFICGTAGESNLMAFTQDFFSIYFDQISVSNLDELLQELSSVIEGCVTISQKKSNRTLLQLLLVIDGHHRVYYYNYGHYIQSDPNQFPAIGSGSTHAEEIFKQNSELSTVEYIQYAIDKDSDSGGNIYTTGFDFNSMLTLKSVLKVESNVNQSFLEQLKAWMPNK
jgi:ATP-dependent protease HslVU (ClpYQ) peptidase subunit